MQSVSREQCEWSLLCKSSSRWTNSFNFRLQTNDSLELLYIVCCWACVWLKYFTHHCVHSRSLLIMSVEQSIQLKNISIIHDNDFFFRFHFISLSMLPTHIANLQQSDRRLDRWRTHRNFIVDYNIFLTRQHKCSFRDAFQFQSVFVAIS